MIACLRDCDNVTPQDSRVISLIRWETSQCWVKTESAGPTLCYLPVWLWTQQTRDVQPTLPCCWPIIYGQRYYDASPISKQHWANVPCLLGKRRRNTGPDPVCVQEIGLHSLTRHHPSYQYQTTRDHSYTGAVAGTSGGNLGTAQQILLLKKPPAMGEMPACPALLKPRSATRTCLKIVHWPWLHTKLPFLSSVCPMLKC